MVLECSFDNLTKGTKCARCGIPLPKTYSGPVSRNCIGPPCQHLGPAIERDGVTIKVKCGCDGREHDQPHTAHECGPYSRCLPTLIPTDMEAWMERKPESDIYHLCHGCKERKQELNWSIA